MATSARHRCSGGIISRRDLRSSRFCFSLFVHRADEVQNVAWQILLRLFAILISNVLDEIQDADGNGGDSSVYCAGAIRPESSLSRFMPSGNCSFGSDTVPTTRN